ncbi:MULTISPECIES: hypothetical protein [unclassified Mameliella]|uniref:hypothetical protein n=1 Tax=unclassified Mameliella TaxID=2630630 RepID=UPI00273D894E|nr:MULTISPECIES: hypothetical protein [unclassified Mameliella]
MTDSFAAFLFLAVLVGALAGFGAGCLAAWAIRHRTEVARREARLNWEDALAVAEARSRDTARGVEKTCVRRNGVRNV